MPRYEDVLNKASELYAVMDDLIAYYYDVHREDDALVVTHTKLAIQKHLSVPPQVMRPDPPQATPPVALPVPTIEVIHSPVDIPVPPVFEVEPEPEPEEPEPTPVKRSHKRK